MSTKQYKPGRARSLPMIVDVAVDQQGNTLYRVHENTGSIQQVTPISSRLSESATFSFDSNDDSHSPTGSVSSTHSPCEDEQRPSTSESPDSSAKNLSGIRASRYCPASQDDIWSSDVEAAFEEALSIVPKCGLTKIKIAGKCCGRNELIADFILAKTGKFRSRKQVSSHIQVVKNMKSKEKLVRLINDGPGSSCSEEAEDNMKRFEDVFSKININKSLGLNSTGSSGLQGPGGSLRRRSAEQLTIPQKRRKSPVSSISVKNISFCIDTDAFGSNPTALTKQEDVPMKSLSLKENANITFRFPGLEEFSNTNVPLIHNMVNIVSPLHLATTHSIDASLRTNFKVEMPGSCENLSSFTTVYSFGDEVLKVNEENFQSGVDQPFLMKFWKCFFLQILNLPTSLDTAFKGVTIKQVIYDNTVPVSSILPKSQIRAILLWEFSKVDHIDAAVSSSSRLFLPPTLGYASMTTNNSNYSIRPPQPTYTSSQSPLDASSRHFTYTPSSSTSSLKNLSNQQNYELPNELNGQRDFAGISHFSFPNVSHGSGLYEQPLPLQNHVPVMATPPISSNLDGDSMSFFAQEDMKYPGHLFQ